MGMKHAIRGIWLFFKKTHNAWIQLGIFIIVVILGLYFEINEFEWGMIILASGLVFASEGLNTAIEVDMDLTSPSYHPYARDTKDLAAGAVLISSIAAFIVGLIIFANHI